MAYTSEQKQRKAATTRVVKPRTPSEITLQQETFANAVLEGSNLSNAARAAGIPVASAGNVLRTNQVQMLIEEARREISNITTLKRIDVMNLFLEAIDMARTMADPANMINGADKIAKMLGYYAPETKRLELTMDQNLLQNKLRSLSDDELADLASSRATVVDGEVVG
ncbi:MAG: hypothetical protein IPH08_04900 [Rhodocyclaceae bacterium]|jgi:hypothetical protein|nr:hypothetical protein [Rhodocyclaceae bacterium]